MPGQWVCSSISPGDNGETERGKNLCSSGVNHIRQQATRGEELAEYGSITTTWYYKARVSLFRRTIVRSWGSQTRWEPLSCPRPGLVPWIFFRRCLRAFNIGVLVYLQTISGKMWLLPKSPDSNKQYRQKTKKRLFHGGCARIMEAIFSCHPTLCKEGLTGWQFCTNYDFCSQTAFPKSKWKCCRNCCSF